MNAPEIRLVAGVEIRGDGYRTLVGKVAPYNTPAVIGGRFVETIAAGCFTKSISERARALPLLTFHDHQSFPVGKAVRWEEEAGGLIGEFEFDTRAEAQEVARLAGEGFLTALSVGFKPVRSQWTRDDDDSLAVTRHEAQLVEVSLVPVGAYETAGVLSVRSAGCPDVPGSKPTPRLDAARAAWGLL
jgi:HK97 family phage prohead protease